MKSTKLPKQVKLTPEQVESLIGRLQTNSLLTEDIDIVTRLISFNLWVREQLHLAKLSIHRLKRIFGISTEKKRLKKRK